MYENSANANHRSVTHRAKNGNPDMRRFYVPPSACRNRLLSMQGPMLHIRTLVMAVIPLAMAACSQQADDTALSSDGGLFVRGTAKVVSVNPALGRTVLEIDGQQVTAFWETQTAVAQGGTVTRDDQLKPPVGHYVEPLVKEQEFAASPGDTIAFIGMRSGKEIFLRNIQVIAH